MKLGSHDVTPPASTSNSRSNLLPGIAYFGIDKKEFDELRAKESFTQKSIRLEARLLKDIKDIAASRASTIQLVRKHNREEAAVTWRPWQEKAFAVSLGLITETPEEMQEREDVLKAKVARLEVIRQRNVEKLKADNQKRDALKELTAAVEAGTVTETPLEKGSR